VALLTKNAEVGRRRVLIVKPSLLPPGGGETVAAWMIEALKDAYDVALVSWTRPDFKRVNEAYATSIRDEDVDCTRSRARSALRSTACRRGLHC
jgi:hypothetical protein